MIPVLDNTLYLSEAVLDASSVEDGHHIFTSPHGEDARPLLRAAVVEFCRILDQTISMRPAQKIVYCVGEGRRRLAVAAFLLGSYLILVRRRSPDEAWARLQDIRRFEQGSAAAVAAHAAQAEFGAKLVECWRGLARGHSSFLPEL